MTEPVFFIQDSVLNSIDVVEEVNNIRKKKQCTLKNALKILTKEIQELSTEYQNITISQVQNRYYYLKEKQSLTNKETSKISTEIDMKEQEKKYLYLIEKETRETIKEKPVEYHRELEPLRLWDYLDMGRLVSALDMHLRVITLDDSSLIRTRTDLFEFYSKTWGISTAAIASKYTYYKNERYGKNSNCLASLRKTIAEKDKRINELKTLLKEKRKENISLTSKLNYKNSKYNKSKQIIEKENNKPIDSKNNLKDLYCTLINSINNIFTKNKSTRKSIKSI